jgi:ubiquitin carboxyl-terminal hydrolase 5/13
LSSGQQVGEELLPEEPPASDGAASSASAASGAAAPVMPDEALVVQLVSMGFSENGCKRAAIATNNANAEVAMEWIFSHMEDPDFNDPPAPSNSSETSPSTASDFNPEHIASLTSMGFSEDQVKCALSQTGQNPERAGDWLFNHMDTLDVEVASWQSGKASTATRAAGGPAHALDGSNGEYTLVGFISHIGRNTSSGHYVCHIKKNGRWVIFNDDKVALSEEPPLGAGYLYFYRRADVAE